MLLLATFLLSGLSRAHDLGRHFGRADFTLGPKTLRLWIADTDPKRARGLMYVDRLETDEGMLFVFDQTQPMSFWMKNTMIPLAIGFFDESCVLREVIEMEVLPSVLASDVRTYHAKAEAKFALEMNAGWFGTKIKPGARLRAVAKAGRKSGSLICK